MKLRIGYLLLPVALILSSTSPAVASDTAPPQLVDWSSPGGADISTADGLVKAIFILSDDSDIDLPKLLLKSLTTTQMTPFATVKVIQKNGKLISYEATAVVQKGQAPKNWEWVLYPLNDSLGNRSTIFGPGGNWNAIVSIYNSEYSPSTARCERSVTSWNSGIARLEVAEKKYPGYQDFSIFRLKYFRPLIKLELTLCATNPSDFDVNSGTGLNDGVSEVIERVTAKWQEAADKVALDKAAADKAAADKAAIKPVAKPLVKEKTIICLKGKSSLKVIGKNPKCPAGYKVKK
jgi:hypothetical protein